MSRYPQPRGERGSLRWIQEFVNRGAGVLDQAIEDAARGRIRGPIDWRSPLVADDIAEYCDQACLERLGVAHLERSLGDFWPRRGPQWDALGRDTSDAIVLVEAKANVPELISPACGAGSSSLKRIQGALQETAEHLGATPTCDWTGTFYQYTNRLAHLYFLHQVNGIPSWLVFVYFVGDETVAGPRTKREWEAALEVLHGALGLRRHPMLNRVLDVFIPVDLPKEA